MEMEGILMIIHLANESQRGIGYPPGSVDSSSKGAIKGIEVASCNDSDAGGYQRMSNSLG